MNGVRNSLSEKNEQILKVIDFIRISEEQIADNCFRSFDSIKPDIKASVIVMLYNEVESTMAELLQRLFEIIFSGEYAYSDYNEKINALLLHYQKNHVERGKDIYKYNNLYSCVEMITDRNKITISYVDFSKYYSLYSGNLDSKEIKSILDKFGIMISDGESVLKSIKDGRNKLSHGIFSFAEVGRDVSYQQLKIYSEKTYNYMRKIIEYVEDYVNNTCFLSSHYS